MAKSSLWNVYKSVLSVGNAEQNSAYPPYISDSHYNIVTSFILDGLSAIYPKQVDKLLPFIKSKKIPVTDGYIQLPTDYRSILGAPSISVKPGGGDCGDNNPVVIDTKEEYKTANMKAGCKTYPVEIVSKDEWDARTTSGYAFPTHETPIGMFIPDKRIKVCPYDIARVEIMYVKNEQEYRLGYILQPDDTYLPDDTATVESEWEDEAFQMLFKGMLALYSAYSKDNQVQNFSQILNQAGLF